MKPAAGGIDPQNYDAVLFDLDGVLTATAKIHAASWQEMFDEFLRKRASERGEPFRPFDIGEDYLRYVDGKPRTSGAFPRAKTAKWCCAPPESSTCSNCGSTEGSRVAWD
jgi:beta-phosphoglucomutase-like phosphatase (HAD superfamily)